MCGEPEFNEDVEGWIPGKQVGYFMAVRES